MEIRTEIRDIKVNTIKEIPWLRVKYSPKPTTARRPNLTLSIGDRLLSKFPTFTPTSSLVVLQRPESRTYGLVRGYRQWRGAQRRKLLTLQAQVLLPTADQYRDPVFAGWLQDVATPPSWITLFQQAMPGGKSKGTRTLYRAQQIINGLHQQLYDQLDDTLKLSKRATLALARAPRDDQPDILEQLKREQRPLTTEQIEAVIRKRYLGSALPSLKLFETMNVLCRKLQKNFKWSTTDITLALWTVKELSEVSRELLHFLITHPNRPGQT